MSPALFLGELIYLRDHLSGSRALPLVPGESLNRHPEGKWRWNSIPVSFHCRVKSCALSSPAPSLQKPFLWLVHAEGGGTQRRAQRQGLTHLWALLYNPGLALNSAGLFQILQFSLPG